MHNALPRLILLVVIVGCAGHTARPEECAPVPEDQWLGALPVYRACSVDRPARTIGSTPRVQYSPTRGPACMRATLDVVVDTEGRPVLSTVKTVRSTDPGFLQALLTALEARRYEPAQRDGRAVAQIVRVDEAMEVRTVVMRADAPPPRAPRRPSC